MKGNKITHHGTLLVGTQYDAFSDNPDTAEVIWVKKNSNQQLLPILGTPILLDHGHGGATSQKSHSPHLK